MIRHLYLTAVIYGPALGIALVAGIDLITPARTRKGGTR